ncbi:hypothetical protein [Pseudoalteromonas tunicata]|jgi:hypothetical protein|uniref:Uncharacterized protein n=1 Tax=Pseudoalteromonas tunicata D2 TaxID=87626 RepID=A4CCD5_9GAMM|nr:hypothetical protein [Pseudoalteromonas tunicata]ATC94569.1 hypothetical protein PTUN_a2028 [Pseudoalteromonas tunicata]AXT30296.1 hypothetical protein D1819_05345 [Pseudoalteromonas tunicata]EAR28022.1 hypothetical protein PTD2_19410 [Pseudoalteromonas tunicata D2]MDP4984297.1 hypothetical protein [Pseudoalteromonas tunicata]
MKKTDKKMNTAVIKQLNALCDELTFTLTGFRYVSHTLEAKSTQYAITVLLYFDTPENKDAAQLKKGEIVALIQSLLLPTGLTVNEKEIKWLIE